MKTMCIVLGLLLVSPAYSDDPVEASLPATPGKASSGGYSFEYQSQRTKAHRIHRLRNMPGGGVVPVDWKSEDGESLIRYYIPRCEKTEQECGWEEAKIKITRYKQATSVLGFGVDFDEEEIKPPAFVLEEDANSGEVDSKPKKAEEPMAHNLKGRFSTPNGERVFSIDLWLASVAKGPPGDSSVTYTVYCGPSTDVEMMLGASKLKNFGDAIVVQWQHVPNDVLLEPRKIQRVKEGESPKVLEGMKFTAKFNDRITVLAGSAKLFYRGTEIARFQAPVHGQGDR